MQTGLDEKDREIIRLLRQDARRSYSEMGALVGLSRTAVKNRIAALERAGTIRGYRAVVDPLAYQGMMPFIINLEVKPEHFDAAKAYFERAKETVTLLQTSGRCHLVAVCMAQDVPAMRRYVNEVYRSVEGLTTINAHSILEVIKGGVIPD